MIDSRKQSFFANMDVYNPLWCNIFEKSDSFPLSKNLLLCKGNAHECTNNDSSQTNASLKPCE